MLRMTFYFLGNTYYTLNIYSQINAICATYIRVLNYIQNKNMDFCVHVYLLSKMLSIWTKKRKIFSLSEVYILQVFDKIFKLDLLVFNLSNSVQFLTEIGKF